MQNFVRLKAYIKFKRKEEILWKKYGEISKNMNGLYQVSNLGRVKSLDRPKRNYDINTGLFTTITIQGKIRKPRLTSFGYYTILLSKNGKRKWFFIHRLVAEAFIPNPDNLPEVNHKDENKLNNNVENLEWCDAKYNSNYGTRNKRISKIKTNNTYNTKSVLCVETGIVYSSTREAARQTGIRNTNISSCARRQYGYKTAGGYHWKYI